MGSPIKYVLFDFDGTLANTFSYYKKLLLKQGIPNISEDSIDKYRDMHFWDVIKELKIPIWKIIYLAWWVKTQLNKDIESIKPFDGIRETLSKIRELNIYVGILSINSTSNIKKFLQHNSLDNYIKDVWTIFITKEKDTAIKSILSKKNLNINELLYVGDEIRDIRAAKKSGIKIAAVTWGVNSKQSLIENGADYIVEKPEDLISIL